MKKLLFVLCLSFCFISCDKNELDYNSGVGNMQDLLGTYSVTVEENVFWGGDSGTIYDKGTITITKLSKNRVQLNGLISTKGKFIDGKLYLDSETTTNNYGYLSTTYKSVIFGAGILTIWSETLGQLATTSNGILYPFNSLCYFEGTKIKE